jgi:hypothetical protein
MQKRDAVAGAKAAFGEHADQPSDSAGDFLIR